ncbi:MAG: inositol monophosphatase [Candidatus Latescibacteria bacterium]|nr:inositol monophosphatase [Candidatus Latescibacterota bacterium]
MIEVAVEAAQAAGAILREHFGTELKVDQQKHYDVKLEVDRLCEERILEIIRRHCPDCGILAEESGQQDRPSPYTWIIDPLDGTANYFRGVPHFCTSIALQHREETILGVVYDPLGDELFVAEKDRGAHLNGAPIHVSAITRIEQSFITCGFMKTEDAIRRGLKRFERLAFRASKMRIMGSAALNLCYVAMGRFDGYVEYGIRAWDLAAGALLTTEAGGRVDARLTPDGGYDVLATNGTLHGEIERLLDEGNEK